MNKAEFNALKARAQKIREKATDMDTLVAAIMKLNFGQLKKVLSDDVMAVLEKYGYKN